METRAEEKGSAEMDMRANPETTRAGPRQKALQKTNERAEAMIEELRAEIERAEGIAAEAAERASEEAEEAVRERVEQVWERRSDQLVETLNGVVTQTLEGRTKTLQENAEAARKGQAELRHLLKGLRQERRGMLSEELVRIAGAGAVGGLVVGLLILLGYLLVTVL